MITTQAVVPRMTNKKLSIPVHGPSFVDCRRERGWSQDELARRSGYSTRVIRKAEAGGSLKTETLQDFCAAFSQSGQRVDISRLTCSTLQVAQKIVHSYDHFGIDMLKHCGECLTEDIVYHIHADPARVPYAGRWSGLDGFQRFLGIFFGIFQREPGILQPTYMTGENRVHARFLDRAVYQGAEIGPIIINLHFEFRGPLVCRMDNEFDSDSTVSSFISIESSTPP